MSVSQPLGVQVHWLGRVPYRDALELQRGLQTDRKADRICDQLLLLEHPPVITVSARGAGHLKATGAELVQAGVVVESTDRGGDITYHGPGQLVGYPILRLGEGERDLHLYLRNLEEALIQWLAERHIEAFRVPGRTGVWAGPEGAEQKLAAIGIRASRWVTLHGFALNLAPELSHFDLIVPCGIADRGVGAVADHTRLVPSVEDAAASLTPYLLQSLARTRVPGLPARLQRWREGRRRA